MSTISVFYGIIVRMYFGDSVQHHAPHIHVWYQGSEAVVRIPDGELLDGRLPGRQMKLLQAWIAIHEDDLMAAWHLALNHEAPPKIEPLR